jgi:hypothetical protein
MTRSPISGMALFALVSACGPLGTRTEAKLEIPVYVWNREAGFCGSTRAVDAQAGLWSEGGCENGGTQLSFQKTLPAEHFSKIEAAFQGHPDPATFKSAECDEDNVDTVNRFTERRADGTTREWRVCIVEQVIDPNDATLYPEPFDATVRAFNGF